MSGKMLQIWKTTTTVISMTASLISLFSFDDMVDWWASGLITKSILISLSSFQSRLMSRQKVCFLQTGNQVGLDSVLWPLRLARHNRQCPCFSAVQEATHKARLRARVFQNFWGNGSQRFLSTTFAPDCRETLRFAKKLRFLLSPGLQRWLLYNTYCTPLATFEGLGTTENATFWQI